MREWLRKSQMVAMLALASVAVLIVLSCASIWLPLAYWALGSACLLVTGQKRLWTGVACAAVLVMLGLWLLPWRGLFWLLLIPAGYAVLLFYTVPIAGWTHEVELPFAVCFGGCMAFVVAQLAQMLKPETYAPSAPWLLGSFLAYGALWMLSLNRQSLLDAAAHGKRAPQGVRRRNLLLTIGLMALVLLLSSIPALAHALRWGWERFKALVKAIWQFIASLLPGETVAGGSGGGGGMGMLGGEAAKAAPWVEIMEKILAALALIALAALMLYALRIIWRKLRVLLKRLWTMLGRYAQAASEDYVDEVSDTRETGETAASSRKGLFGDWLKHINEDRLTPAERIRYRYKRLMRRHEEWLPGSTARENLPLSAASLYERARYASQPITAQEAETFAAQAKELEKKA